MKTSLVAASAAILGSVAASQHKAHAGFHLRRHADEEVCTVYTTVYVTASQLPPMVANSTVYVSPSPVPGTSTESCTEETATSTAVYSIYTPPVPVTSTAEAANITSVYSIYTPPVAETPTESCTDEIASSTSVYSVYTPPAPSSTQVAYTPSAPSSTKVAYTPPAPSSTEVAYTPVPVSTETPSPSKAAYTAPVYSAPVYTPVSKPSSSKAAAKPSPSAGTSYSSSGRIVTKGDKWAITYTPYSSTGDCKTASEVKSDIAEIAGLGFTTIRSYSTDCGVFENVVPAASAHGLKVIYGIYLEAGGSGGKGPFSSYANNQLEEIISSAPKDSVALVIVGNEFLFNSYGTAAELGSYIDYVRKQLTGAGFPTDIAVTTTEPVDIWQAQGAALCAHIDVFAVQIHPFFDANTAAANAGDFVSSQLSLAASVCPVAASKGKFVTETGWPSAGEANGLAIPGVSEQKEALSSILAKVGTEACIFSFQDDKWKAAGQFGVEQSWGCASVV